MTERKRVGIGMIGSGFLAETRASCYAQVGAPASIVAVVSRSEERARAYAVRHRIPTVCASVEDLLALPEVDVVDLCVPNLLHLPMATAAAAAGKHVICTKPLTAYVGQDLPDEASEEEVGARDRREMLRVALADAEAMVAAAQAAGVQLMYGENWVYAPSVVRACDMLIASGGTLVEMHGWESHNGSHSVYSKIWRHAGGGALLRLAAHPIGAMLRLKHEEGVAREGRPIRPVAVSADVGDLSRAPSLAHTRSWLASGWRDVENWGCAIISFEDGTRGVAHGSDNLLGGMQSKLRLMASNCYLECNLSPHDLLRAYAPDDAVFGDEYIMEKVDGKSGWNTPLPNEAWSSGHLDMCRDFVTAVEEGRPALATGELGLEVVRVVYSAYVAATEGCRVDLSR